LFSLEGSHHSGDRALVAFLPLGVLGLLAELAELFIEVQTNIEVEIVTLFVFVDQGDTLEVHIGVLDGFPSNAVDELGFILSLRPVSVQESDGLLREGLGANVVEELKGLRVQLLSERRSSLLS
jgi:hypothetical protein